MLKEKVLVEQSIVNVDDESTSNHIYTVLVNELITKLALTGRVLDDGELRYSKVTLDDGVRLAVTWTETSTKPNLTHRAQIRNFVFVEAVQVQLDNAEDIAAWCGGEVLYDGDFDGIYILVSDDDKPVIAGISDYVVKIPNGSYLVLTDNQYFTLIEKFKGDARVII